MQSNKYGLRIRVPKSQQKQQQARPLPPKPIAFNDDDDDDVEKEISRQAFKNKSLKDVEDQYKKALEEDPSVFDYDGVYDDMKAKIVKPKAEDRQQRQCSHSFCCCSHSLYLHFVLWQQKFHLCSMLLGHGKIAVIPGSVRPDTDPGMKSVPDTSSCTWPKYIQALMEKAKKREKEHEVVYERKLAKERSKDDHLYADKDKFVTGAYKRKLAEQAKWMEEERLRELREEKDNVTKKSDLTDFYFNLAKNVAFGAEEKSKKSGRGDKESAAATEELKRPEKEVDINKRAVGNPSTSSAVVSPSRLDDRLQGEAAVAPEVRPEPAANLAPSPPTSTEVIPPPPTDKPKQDHHKKSQEALAAAKERFLARKKAKMEL